MLLVKTRLDRSQISGIGLYADEFITKGTVIWRFTPGLDLKFNREQLEEFKSRLNVARLEDFIYRSKISGDFILCADDARFINHSFSPNTIDTMEDTEGLTIASRDIFPGEEIVSDYQAFDADFDNYRHLLKEVELVPVSSNGTMPKRRPKLR
jgi:SET domain-containing protein